MRINPSLLTPLGLGPKAAPLYEAALNLGEASVQDLAQVSGIKRTTIYYILPSLLKAGVLIETRRNKKIYYLPESPETVLKRAQERLIYAEKTLAAKKSLPTSRPRIYFLYDPSGFKQVWEKIFASKSKVYRIITDGSSFLDFVKEKYILNEIIATKRKKGISSKQIIVDSPYARSIVAKDAKENRTSRFLPRQTTLPFTLVIGDTCTAFISPRKNNTLFVIENEEFSQTQQSIFDEMWKGLPDRLL